MAEVDHYKFWLLNSIGFEREVTTLGQFDTAPVPQRVLSLEYIGNPVSKNGEPVSFPDRHLTGYRLQPNPSVPEPHRRVVFANQFGPRFEWHIGDPELLLLPAGKSFADGKPADPTPPLTHYLCYQVRSGEMVNREVQLSDQFDAVIGHPELVGPLYPAYFAVPVQKNDEEIGNPVVHLAVYRFQPREGLASPIFIRTSDQFIPLAPILEQVVGPQMLAVPSQKLEWGLEP